MKNIILLALLIPLLTACSTKKNYLDIDTALIGVVSGLNSMQEELQNKKSKGYKPYCLYPESITVTLSLAVDDTNKKLGIGIGKLLQTTFPIQFGKDTGTTQKKDTITINFSNILYQNDENKKALAMSCIYTKDELDEMAEEVLKELEALKKKLKELELKKKN